MVFQEFVLILFGVFVFFFAFPMLMGFWKHLFDNFSFGSSQKIKQLLTGRRY